LNALMIATVVGAITAWLTMVDERVSSLDHPSIPLYRALGRSILVGAVVAAACVAALPLLSGAHAAHMQAISRHAWQLVELTGKERAVSLRLGRLALAEEHTASPEYLRTLAVAEAQGNALDGAWAAFAAHEQLTSTERAALPDYDAIDIAQARYIALAHQLAASAASDRDATRRELQKAVDAYAQYTEGAGDIVSALEHEREQLENPTLAEWLAPIILFMLALGMLWPLLRLVA